MTRRNGKLDRVHAILRDRMHLDVPSPTTDLFADGILDSLTFVDLLARLELEFGITVELEDTDLDAFRTVEAIERFVSRIEPHDD